MRLGSTWTILHQMDSFEAASSSNQEKQVFNVSAVFGMHRNGLKLSKIHNSLPLFSTAHNSVWMNFKPHNTLVAPLVREITFPMIPHTTLHPEKFAYRKRHVFCFRTPPTSYTIIDEILSSREQCLS